MNFACTGAASSSVLSTLWSNLDDLLTRVRGVVGPEVQIIGLTYPDVFLGS